MLQALHDEFTSESGRENKPRLLLTVAVAVGESTIAESYNVPAMSRLVVVFAFININPENAHMSSHFRFRGLVRNKERHRNPHAFLLVF